MKNIATFILSVIFPVIIISVILRDASRDNTLLDNLREEYSVAHIPSVDHSKHEQLQQEFEDPHELTATCLSCHTERGKEVLGNAHWLWEREAFIEGRGGNIPGQEEPYK